MPFAVIAVTILLIAGTYAAVTALYDQKSDNIGNMDTELDVFDESIEDIRHRVSRGMGELIQEISRNDVGTLQERADRFDKLAKDWMRFQFPMSNGVVTAKLNDHIINLDSESLKVYSGSSSEASKPIYLCASGHINVSLSSANGSAEKTITISADGSSALPFLVGQASLFELAVEGETSLLSQMISYQLSSLVQYRVIQGYGSISEYGMYGTRSILTEKDVHEAYRNAMSAIEMLYFRSDSGNAGFEGMEKADLGEKIVAKDGYIELDMAMIYAQTFGSMIDRLVIQWLDYFMITDVMKIVDWLSDIANDIADGIKDLGQKLLGFFGVDSEGKDTAGKYLREIMDSNGYSGYRKLMRDLQSSVTIPGGTYSSKIFQGTSVNVPQMNVSFSYPDSDVTEWSGWNNYLKEYRHDNNEMKETIFGLLNSISLGLGKSYGKEIVRINVNASDDSDFATSLVNAVNDALVKQNVTVTERAKESLSEQRMVDPLYASMFRKMEMERESIFGADELKKNLESSIRSAVSASIQAEYGMLLDMSVYEEATNDAMRSSGVKAILEDYDRRISERLNVFEGLLNSITVSGGIMKDLFKVIIINGLMRMDIFPAVKGTVIPLCTEMAESISMNTSGMAVFSGMDVFHMSDNEGNSYEEHLNAILNEKIDVSVVTPAEDSSKNAHYVGFLLDEDHKASYSSVFTVRISSEISYTASSRSSISEMLGIVDSTYSGTVKMSTEIIVPALSAWALMGVDYTPTNTILGDLKEALIIALKAIFEPLLGPLREFYRMVNSVLATMASAMVEFSMYVASLVQTLMERIAGPLEKIQGLLNSFTGSLGGALESIISISVGSQTLGFRFHEFEMTLTMNIVEAVTKHRTVVKVEISLPIMGTTVKVGLEVKRNESKEYSFAGTASIIAETWNLNIAIDPFMKVRRHLVEITGTIRNTDIRITMPELIQYEELELRLSDIPGVGTMLSNIPLPIPGMKGSIDAGMQLKYNTPYKHGLVINEFESNPEGNDSGKEWVELYNSTSKSIDIEGYVIVPSTGVSKSYEITGVREIAPGERMVITLPGTKLNNSAGAMGLGESVRLLDTNGNEVDITPWKADTANDDKTWQRTYDGSTSWSFAKATKGEKNGGKIAGGNAVKVIIQDILVNSAAQAMGEMKILTSGLDIENMIKRTLELVIKNAIETIAGCIVEASVFIEVKVSEYTGSAYGGVRLALTVGPDIIRDGLNWMVGSVHGMVMNIDNPSGLKPMTILSDDVFIKFTAFAGIGMPKFLRAATDARVEIAVVVGCNISAVNNLFGNDGGTWRVTAGVMIEDIPAAFVPVSLKADMDRHADLWLVKAEFQRHTG